MAVSSRTVPDDQGHAADSRTGQPRRGRASRRRLSGRGDSPTSRTARTEPASVVQCVPAAKKGARSRRAPQRSGPRPGAYPAPSFFVGARCANAASIVIPFPPREHTVEPGPSWVQKLGCSWGAASSRTSIASAFPDSGGCRGLVVRLSGALSSGRPARRLGVRPPPAHQLAMPAQQRRRRYHESVPAPVREQSRERGDERTIGGAKPRALLLASENRELVSQEHQFHVLGELGSSIADEQPQNSGNGKVGEGKEHRPILPGPVAPLRLRVLAWISRFWYSRARVKPGKDASQDSKPPGRASQNHTGHGEGTAGRRIHARTRIGVLAPFTHLLPRFPNPGLLAQDSLRRQRCSPLRTAPGRLNGRRGRNPGEDRLGR
jgi:hypothetical protein